MISLIVAHVELLATEYNMTSERSWLNIRL